MALAVTSSNRTPHEALRPTGSRAPGAHGLCRGGASGVGAARTGPDAHEHRGRGGHRPRGAMEATVTRARAERSQGLYGARSPLRAGACCQFHMHKRLDCRACATHNNK